MNHFYRLIFSEHSEDALRNTLASIMPSVLVYLIFKDLETSIAVGVGSLLASLTDMPGGVQDKWLSAKWCVLSFFLATLLTSYFLSVYGLLILWLMLSGFCCGMFFIFGQRIILVAILNLIVISFTIGLWPDNPLIFSLQVTCGAIIYFAISIAQVYGAPFRSVKHALNSSFTGMSALLRAKSQFYDDQVSVDVAYVNVSALHVKVSEQQDQTRLILLREEKVFQNHRADARYWFEQLYGSIDLYELLAAISYDYDYIRKVLAPTDTLVIIRRIILLLADQLDHMAQRISTSVPIQSSADVKTLIEQLRAKDDMQQEAQVVLADTITNIMDIQRCIDQLQLNAPQKNTKANIVKDEVLRFITVTPINFKLIAKHLTFKSPAFLFGLRWALLFGIGGFIGFLLPDFRYAYWILLTIAIVARPSYAVTKKRNHQRVVGTMVGACISLILLFVGISPVFTFSLAIIGLYVFFLFNQLNYTVSVIFITITALLMLHIYDGNEIELMGSRIVFTLLGTFFALLGWFLFPVKQGGSLESLAKRAVAENQVYLHVVVSFLRGNEEDVYNIRLGRKQAHTALANFTNSFLDIRKEPDFRNFDWSSALRFQAMLYRVNSLTIGLSHLIARNLSTQQEELDKLEDRLRYVEKLLEELEERSSFILNDPEK